jgi:hypothetical protein
MTFRPRFRLLAAMLLVFLCAGAGSSARAQDGIDPHRLALGAQLLDLAGAKTMVVQMLDQVGPGLTQLIQQANPGKETEVAEVMNQYILPRMKHDLPDAMQACAAVYASHFTADELSQLIGFYQSPLGRKLVQEQPAMGQELARLGSAWAQSAAMKAIHDYAEEFRKRGLDTPI